MTFELLRLVMGVTFESLAVVDRVYKRIDGALDVGVCQHLLLMGRNRGSLVSVRVEERESLRRRGLEARLLREKSCRRN